MLGVFAKPPPSTSAVDDLLFWSYDGFYWRRKPSHRSSFMQRMSQCSLVALLHAIKHLNTWPEKLQTYFQSRPQTAIPPSTRIMRPVETGTRGVSSGSVYLNAMPRMTPHEL